MSYTSRQTTKLSPSVRPHTSTLDTQPICFATIASEVPRTSTNRSDVLRHVLPLPSSKSSPQDRPVPSRISRSFHNGYHSASGRRRSKSGVGFHRYITSLFGNSNNPNIDLLAQTSRSRTSSFGSRRSSSLQGSVPSIDLVSPAAFKFSGPSLRPSTSRLPSLAETGSEIQSLSRGRTDSFSLLGEASILDKDLLEPIVEGGIMPIMSDVLLGVSTPVDQAASLNLQQEALKHANSEVSSAQENLSHAVADVRCYQCREAGKLAALLLSYLDFGA
jgi:hypothetical protein